MTEGKGGIPAWQRADYREGVDKNATEEKNADKSVDAASGEDGEKPSKPALDAAHSSPPSEHQRHLLHQASRFLDDPQIRDAPVGAKRDFLESKGLAPGTIDQIPQLSLSSPAEETPPNILTASAPAQSKPQPRQVSSPAASTPQSARNSSPSSPPIITYPEHLLKRQKPPPLVTTSRILNTAYAFAGLAATAYGLSSYLVKPMTESLSAARQDFHSHSQSKIEEMNKRLESIVSVDPALGMLKAREDQLQDASSATDAASEDSDPTELFHRDIGTQTMTEDLPKRPWSESSSHSEIPQTFTEVQQRQLDRIKSAAATLASDTLSSESQAVYEFRTISEMLREQLEAITFPATSDGGSFGIGNSSAGFSNLYGTDSTSKKESSEFGKMKNEIRSLKGSLLSARSFPAGGAVPVGRKDLFPAQ